MATVSVRYFITSLLLISPFFDHADARRCSVKKCFRNFAKFTGKHMCKSLFFNKVAGLRPATLLKKRLWHMCFT